MDADVFFLPAPATTGCELAPPDLRPGLKALIAALRLTGAARQHARWALPVSLGNPGRPAPVPAAWARAVAEALAGDRAMAPPPGAFCCDTLSITTKGLDTPEAHLATARIKGYGAPAAGLPFVVGDDPGEGPALAAGLPAGSRLAALTLAGVLGRTDGCCVLNPVRPHPHLGFRGALGSLGVGLADRAGKIELHREIRPRVDTPLCAGCGVCLTVCLFDAIVVQAGRAVIDHRSCVGCGECMNVCFMAGISPAEAAGIPVFQEKVAEAAAAAVRVLPASPGRWGHFAFLLGLDRQGSDGKNRRREPLADVGVLASRDPVALDQATWDQLAHRSGGGLGSWSGFPHDPERLLARAEELELGRRGYRLQPV